MLKSLPGNFQNRKYWMVSPFGVDEKSATNFTNKKEYSLVFLRKFALHPHLQRRRKCSWQKSDNNIPATVERIADWMETTGGLYLND
jgi:hypothetical protein